MRILAWVNLAGMVVEVAVLRCAVGGRKFWVRYQLSEKAGARKKFQNFLRFFIFFSDFFDDVFPW